MPSKMKPIKRQQGFTLIELAIVLVIIGVLIGSFIGTFAQRIENARIVETEDELEEIKTALIGFAYTNGNLPCPDTGGDGVENRTAGACDSGNAVDTLPWVTLGLARADAWGTRYRYWVDTTYGDSATLFTLTNPPTADGIGQILDRIDDGTATQALANNIVAVVISHGKNAYAGISTSGIAQQAIPVANLDEIDNLNADNDFISRPSTDVSATTAGGEFDDILMWVSEFELKAKMVEAGRLP